MTLLELCRRGIGTAVSLALARRLRPQHLWCAIKGAAKYSAAIMAGDEADEVVADARAVLCDLCPSATYEAKGNIGAHAVYCGAAFIDHTGHDDPRQRTCGCLVGVTIGGRTYAGGKTSVRSERCPQEKW